MPVTRLQALKAINASGVAVPNDPACVLIQDGAYTDGQLPIPLNNSYILTNAAVAENAAGDVSINVAAGQNAVIGMCCSEYVKKITSFLSTSSVPPLNNSGQYTDNSGDIPINKGVKIISFELAYSVQGGALTSATFRADLNTQKNAVVNAILNLVPVGQNGLSLAATASATTCSVIQIPVAVGTQVFDFVDATELYIRINPVTPGGVTFRLYGVYMNFTFNWS